MLDTKVPERSGYYELTVFLVSDFYMGLDAVCKLDFAVGGAGASFAANIHSLNSGYGHQDDDDTGL